MDFSSTPTTTHQAENSEHKTQTKEDLSHDLQEEFFYSRYLFYDEKDFDYLICNRPSLSEEIEAYLSDQAQLPVSPIFPSIDKSTVAPETKALIDSATTSAVMTVLTTAGIVLATTLIIGAILNIF